ncbi:AI-2E family transporter [Tessaracoccus terricola]
MSQEPESRPTPLPRRRPRKLVDANLGNPFAWGFLATLGGLVAISLGGALSSLATVLISVGVALFIAMALDPLVRWLEGHKLSRGLAIGVVFLLFFLVVAALLALVIPTAVVQISQFAQSFPRYLTEIQHSEWFQNIIAATGQEEVYENILGSVRDWISDPENILAIGGGALAVGSGLINGVSGTLIVLVLTLYFLASLNTFKAAIVRTAPAYGRPQVARLTDQLTASVGSYVSGMAILAFCNAVFTLVLMSVLGVPFAPLLAVLALFITMIPMIGSVAFWAIASVISVLTIGWLGLVFVGVYFAYMQVEAYVMTPRVMTKAVSIPGSLVLIGAMVGGTLLGLLGALVAVPVTASILTIYKEVFLPKQDAKLTPDDD